MQAPAPRVNEEPEVYDEQVKASIVVVACD